MLGERTQFHQAIWRLTLLLATLFAGISAATPALASLNHRAPLEIQSDSGSAAATRARHIRHSAHYSRCRSHYRWRTSWFTERRVNRVHLHVCRGGDLNHFRRKTHRGRRNDHDRRESVHAAPAAALWRPRFIHQAYAEDVVVPIEGAKGTVTLIVFGLEEHIETVAVGNSSDWQIKSGSQRNVLFVSALRDQAWSNMAVVTDKRSYLFELVAEENQRSPLYAVRFSYDPELKGCTSRVPRTP